MSMRARNSRPSKYDHERDVGGQTGRRELGLIHFCCRASMSCLARDLCRTRFVARDACDMRNDRDRDRGLMRRP
jgi:hypothetical protein